MTSLLCVILFMILPIYGFQYLWYHEAIRNIKADYSYIPMEWDSVLKLVAIAPEKWSIMRHNIWAVWWESASVTVPIYYHEGNEYWILLSYRDWKKCRRWVRKQNSINHKVQLKEKEIATYNIIIPSFQSDIERYKEKSNREMIEKLTGIEVVRKETVND